MRGASFLTKHHGHGAGLLNHRQLLTVQSDILARCNAKTRLGYIHWELLAVAASHRALAEELRHPECCPAAPALWNRPACKRKLLPCITVSDQQRPLLPGNPKPHVSILQVEQASVTVSCYAVSRGLFLVPSYWLCIIWLAAFPLQVNLCSRRPAAVPRDPCLSSCLRGHSYGSLMTAVLPQGSRARQRGHWARTATRPRPT